MKICVVGASGRMGQAVLAAAGAAVVSQVEAGADVAALETALRAAHAYVDFSSSAGTVAVAAVATHLRLPGVIGTTGLTDQAHAAIAQLAAVAPVVVAANFSIGVNVLLDLVRRAAAQLPTWDIEIIEAHHRHKRDAPSGTALSLADAVVRGRGETEARMRQTHTRSDHTEIGIASVRGGSVTGDHNVLLLGTGERIELTHIAESSALFAAGALRAATWVRDRPPGRYGMRDVLGHT